MGPGGRQVVRRLCAAVVPLLLGHPATAEESGDPALVARIFEGLAVGSQIEAIVPVASQQLRSASGTPDPDRRQLARIVARGFAPERLERATQHAFLERLATEDDLARARVAARWLARPSAQRLHAALHAPAPAACSPIAPDAQRVELIEAIDRGTGGSARMVRHSRVVVQHMASAANALLPEWQRLTGPRTRLSPDAPRVDASLRACRFAGLSTAELRSARRFVEGEVGRWLYEGLARALDDALASAARRTARELVRSFEGRGAPAPLRTAGRDGSPGTRRAG